MAVKLSSKKIKETYNIIVQYYKKYLKDFGVKLPKLRSSGKYTRDALILIYLAQDYPDTKIVSKAESTGFIRQYYPDTNDVQQARHLGTQKGWFIAAGGRDNRDVNLHRGEYQLVTLEKKYPAFHGHRIEPTKIAKSAYGPKKPIGAGQYYPAVRQV